MNRTLAIGLLFALASTASAQTPLKTMLDSLVTYVDSGGVSRCSTPIYTAFVNVEGVLRSFVIYEDAAYGLCNDENYKMIVLYGKVLDVPEGFRHPPAMLMALAEMNDALDAGSVGIYNGDGDLYYSSHLWSQVADIRSLGVELVVGHLQSGELNSILAPYLDQ